MNDVFWMTRRARGIQDVKWMVEREMLIKGRPSPDATNAESVLLKNDVILGTLESGR